jgi:trehalose utilization protein
MASLPRITVWNEFRHEKSDADVTAVYPEGIHVALSKMLGEAGFPVRTATLDEPEHGLTAEVLDQTDVLFWWGHLFHVAVSDEIVNRVHERILGGMGLVALHSSHMSKIFRKLMGTSCRLKWRVAAERERVWVVEPSHPIAAGLPEMFEVPHSEMYGERLDIPTPDEVIFMSWYQGGEVFRSGSTFHRGAGRIFYFSPGHETYPIYYQSEVKQILCNAAKWVAPDRPPQMTFGQKPNPLEKLGG